MTLEPAFPGDAGPGLIRQIERNEPRPPRQLQPKIPVNLETVVLKAMSKRREDRYTTAQEFADDLNRVLEGKAPSRVRPICWTARPGGPNAIAKSSPWPALSVCWPCSDQMAGTLLIAREQQKTAQNLALAEKRFREAQDTWNASAHVTRNVWPT